ncbi:elongation of very long chain fatty acids protein 1 [Orussus abietinus]|uniref:elongation of very long chain fatty acids protein 1 n=1 Tax=Orussus abietinus TaxID=222816 RepID=UPI000625780E|nr:elongation of very long chain fatty acids protein 1 [Orussus abietinus]
MTDFSENKKFIIRLRETVDFVLSSGQSNQVMGPVETYRYLIEEVSDPRVADWPLMGSPFPLALLLIGYIVFVLHLGPRYMRSRQPYSLYGFMICYNVLVAIASGIVFYGLVTSWYSTNTSLGCEPVQFSNSPESLNMAKWVWWVMVLKIGELGDTIVFVLRKKYRQLSFLHIYHHFTTAIVAWISCKYVPGGMWTFVMIPNSLVHVVMYTYYLLAGLGPRIQKMLVPWKPYLTILQIAQLLIMFVHTSQMLMPWCEPERKPLAYLYMFHEIVVLYMFWDFYRKSYTSKKTH